MTERLSPRWVPEAPVSLAEWLKEPDEPERSPETAPDVERSPSETPCRPVVPCLVVGSWAYRRASLARKFRAATTGTIPGALEIQRELQALIRTPGFDPWRASLVLMRIEAHVERAHPETHDSRTR